MSSCANEASTTDPGGRPSVNTFRRNSGEDDLRSAERYVARLGRLSDASFCAQLRSSIPPFTGCTAHGALRRATYCNRLVPTESLQIPQMLNAPQSPANFYGASTASHERRVRRYADVPPISGVNGSHRFIFSGSSGRAYEVRLSKLADV